MYINLFFDEDNIADIIFVPNDIYDIEAVQNTFFKWMFDKNNDHPYWVKENGEKAGCQYGTDAFVKWLNETILFDSSDKCRVVEKIVK